VEEVDEEKERGTCEYDARSEARPWRLRAVFARVWVDHAGVVGDVVDDVPSLRQETWSARASRVRRFLPVGA